MFFWQIGAQWQKFKKWISLACFWIGSNVTPEVRAKAPLEHSQGY
jgi:hypothetical protein